MKEMGFIKSENVQTVSQSLIVPQNFTHSVAIGQTGCGKTTSYIYPNLNDRISKGYGLLIYDYKGKEHASVKTLAARHNRLQDVIEIGSIGGSKVNMIAHLCPKDFHNYFMNIYNDGNENIYWFQTAANMATAIMTFLWHYERFMNLPIVNKKIGYKKVALTKLLKLAPKCTINQLYQIVKSLEALQNFVKRLNEFKEKLFTTLSTLLKSIDEEDSKNELLDHYLKIEKATDDVKDTLSIFYDERSRRSANEKLQQTHQASLQMQIAAIAVLEELNSDDVDILQSLDRGKIIVLQVQEIPQMFLNQFTSTLLVKMARRAYHSSPKPVSLFIDEMQRVVNKETDIPIDILREAKVELFCAFQNVLLMEEAMGSKKFYSLFNNFGNIYLYKNPSSFMDVDTTGLNTFEYIHYQDDLKSSVASATLLEDEEKFENEIKFSSMNNIYHKLGIQVDQDCKARIVTAVDDTVVLQYQNGEYKSVRSVTSQQNDKIRRLLDKLEALEEGSDSHEFSEIATEMFFTQQYA